MRIILCLNGIAPKKEMFFSYYNEDCKILCTDGAYNWLKEFSIMPNYLMGDMDSLKYPEILNNNDIEIYKFNAEKDETDGQLALDFALSKKPCEIIIFGALGKRMDHQMGNLQLLYRALKSNTFAYIIDNECRVDIFSGEREFFGKIGNVFSIIPFKNDVRVKTFGLKYPLNDEILYLDTPRGISNVVAFEKILIKTDGGCVLTVYNF